MLKFVYTIFVGILIAAFVGVGIAAFYPGPTPPEYPAGMYEMGYGSPTQQESPEQRQAHEEFQRQSEQLYVESQAHSRNISIIALVAAIIILAGSIAFSHQLAAIADGMIIGGLLTLLYGIFSGIFAGDARFQFITVTVGLVVALILGYIKFLKPASKTADST